MAVVKMQPARRPRQRQTYSVTEAAEVLGISRDHAYRLVRSGQIESVRLGRKIVVSRLHIEQLLGGLTSNLNSAPPPGHGSSG